MRSVRPIAAPELLRAFLLRELGGAGGFVLLAAAALAGALAATAAARYLGGAEAARLPTDFVSAFVLRYPASALYLAGFAYAWRAAGRLGEDAVDGWTVQYFAAGATRDRYLVALTLATGLTALVLYVASALAWAATLAALRRSPAPFTAAATLMPAGMAWLGSTAAFAAAAIALARRAGAAQALMLATLLLPWLALALLAQSLEQAPPHWLRLLFRLSPPYPVSPTPRSIAASALFAGIAFAIAFARSPRLLRVR